MLTLIIGKNSNLSRYLSRYIVNSVLISSRDITENIECLSSYKGVRVNIIFNNFQPAEKLNDVDNYEIFMRNSILVTSIVLDYFSNSDINKIIYTSSSSIYGNNIFCSESDCLSPLNLHASLKISNEYLVEKFCKNNNVDYTIARVFNIYGGDDKFSIISKIISTYENGDVLNIVNGGNSVRDFIYVEDVAMVYAKILCVKNLNYVNVGTGIGISIKYLLDFLKNLNVNVDTSNTNRAELKISTANTTLLASVVDVGSFINIEDYLKDRLLK